MYKILLTIFRNVLVFPFLKINSNSVKIYTLVVEIFPEKFIDESPIFVEVSEDEVEENNTVSLENLYFSSTLIVHSENQDEVVSEFVGWWKENVGGKVHLDLLGCGVECLSMSRLRSLRNLGAGEWTINSRFVAFLRESIDAKNAAMEIICEADLF